MPVTNGRAPVPRHLPVSIPPPFPSAPRRRVLRAPSPQRHPHRHRSHQALDSVETILTLSARDVRAWLAYYTGKSPQQLLDADQQRTHVDADWVSQDLRRALRACTGVEPVLMM